MLVLTRKKSEMIQIGEQIVVKVIHTGRNTVKIGIEAPVNVRVLRAELCDVPEAGHPLAAFLKARPAKTSRIAHTGTSSTPAPTSLPVLPR